MAGANGDDAPGGTATVVWALLGLVAGAALTGKIIVSTGIPVDRPLPFQETVLLLVTFIGPMLLLSSVSNQLAKEADRGSISWATYWTTMAGITVSGLALIGVTSIDDLITIFREWDALDDRPGS